uniref:Alpha-catenin n=1 Tax=Oscarella pearsei TaxID=1940113 RepID=A0A3G2LGG6_OSCPE|nr:alpha-catenin [Oscarella pearsei]|eukprot:m.38738 g.38738  ORF g.38738 m.38738 type:complete len:967 (+) comp32633_c0_seq8:64-2964(+)
MASGVQLRPRNIHVRTRSMELSLQPFIDQVSTLVHKRQKAGKLYRSATLVDSLDKARKCFVAEGRKIAQLNREVEREMLIACEGVESAGLATRDAAEHFMLDPCSSEKRSELVEVAKELLTSVARLLLIADTADVNHLKSAARSVNTWLYKLERAISPEEVVQLYQGYAIDLENLLKLTTRRQMDVKSRWVSEKLAFAKVKLRRMGDILSRSVKLHVQYPDIASAKVNRDFTLSEATQAVRSITECLDEDKAGRRSPPEEKGHTIALFEDFQKDVEYLQVQVSAHNADSLSSHVTSLGRKVTQIADETEFLFSCGESTRKFRLEQVSAALSEIKRTFKDLEHSLRQNLPKRNSPQSESVKALILSKTAELIKLSRYIKVEMSRCAVDDVCDLFSDVDMPLIAMVEPAKSGHRKEVEQRARTFRSQAEMFLQVAKMVGSFSSSPQSLKALRVATKDVQFSYTQVINAARSVAIHPKSVTARKNLESFEDFWMHQVKELTFAVDDVIDIDDFLVVSEYHLLEELKSSMMAVQVGNPDTMDMHLANVKGIVSRLCDVVLAEISRAMDEKQDEYAKTMENSVSCLQEIAMSQYISCIDEILDQLSDNAEALFDERQCSQKARAVLHGVKRVRQAVQSVRTDLLVPDPDEDYLDDDIEPDLPDFDLPPPPPDMLEEANGGGAWEGGATEAGRSSENKPFSSSLQEVTRGGSSSSLGKQHSRTFVRDVDRHVSPSELRNLPEEQKQQIKALEDEKRQLEREVDKFGEVNHDIVVIAKDMCMMMVDMSDFTRGAGPLKSSMDVFDTAQEIARAGKQLNALGRQVAKECPDQSCKTDLLAYLERILLYCHQIRITSQVKADVTTLGGEKTSQALENATTLVTAAKNLMNAVVMIVKLSHVALNKIAKVRGVTEPSVAWKLRAPEKKPLIKGEGAQGNTFSKNTSFSTMKAMQSLEDYSYRPPSLTDEPEEDEWV